MPLMRVHEFDNNHRVIHSTLVNTVWIIQVESLDHPSCGFDEGTASFLRQMGCNSVLLLAGAVRAVVSETIDRIEELADRVDNPSEAKSNLDAFEFLRGATP